MAYAAMTKGIAGEREPGASKGERIRGHGTHAPLINIYDKVIPACPWWAC